MTAIFEVEQVVTEQVVLTDELLHGVTLAALFDEAQAELAALQRAARRDTLETPFVDPEARRPTRELPVCRSTALSREELAAVRAEHAWAWLALAAVLVVSGLVVLL